MRIRGCEVERSYREKENKMKVGIIGLGLIGGSMAIDLKRRGFADEIYGVEADSVNAAAAEKIGLVDRVLTLEECVKESDLTVLAVPVGAAVKMLPEILDMFRAEETASGSCRTARNIQGRGQPCRGFSTDAHASSATRKNPLRLRSAWSKDSMTA